MLGRNVCGDETESAGFETELIFSEGRRYKVGWKREKSDFVLI